MDNSQNFFPVDSGLENKITPPEKSGKNLSVLNVGQILVLAILFIAVCLQAINILFTPVYNIAAEPLPVDTIRYEPHIPAEAKAAAELFTEPEIIFILGEFNGRLAILSADRETVYEVFNVYINTLPEFDRNLLLEGINIKTAEELGSLIEDFSS